MKNMKFNNSQLKFLKDPSKYQRILSPAGSGKTTMILEKVKNILNEQKDSRILILTYTNAGVEELKTRLRDY